MLKIKLDPSGHTAYICLTNIQSGMSVKQIKCDGPSGGTIVLDFDVDGHLLGVELIGAQTLLPQEFQSGLAVEQLHDM